MRFSIVKTKKHPRPSTERFLSLQYCDDTPVTPASVLIPLHPAPATSNAVSVSGPGPGPGPGAPLAVDRSRIIMPGKIFGVAFGRSASPPSFDEATTTATRPPLRSLKSTDDTRRPRPSMDHIRSLSSRKDRSRSHDKHAAAAAKLDHRKSAGTVVNTTLQPKPVKLDMVIESPPVLMIDAPQQSSGALISGRLQLTPQGGDAVLTSCIMYLESTTATKRPVQDRCRECSTQVQDLYEWNFLTHPKSLPMDHGMQDLPFSHLIPGHIPATTHGHIGSVDYSLHVRARTDAGQEIEFRRELIIKRALRPGNDKNSVRVFPPTHFTLHVTLPNVIHPIGQFPVLFRMQGATHQVPGRQDRWRLRKLIWRMEEHEVHISPACALHAAKLGGEGKGLQHEHTRDIGIGELKTGWKTDFSGVGEIEGEFNVAIDHTTHPQTGVEAANGLKITHTLVLELIITEEWAPNKKPSQSTPTGAARVLRTQVALNITDRAGLGIAWDDEQPPMYEDVPDSPPHYQGGQTTRVVDYTGSELHEDVEHLTLAS